MAYDAENIMNLIIERLASGESLRSICLSDGMPNRSTVIRWLDENEDFATKYARAKDIGFDERAEKLAEDIEVEEDVQRAKLKFEYGRWYLSKLAPKRYGERLALAGDESAPLSISVNMDDAAL